MFQEKENRHMQKSGGVVEVDYGTNCKSCERYEKLGDVCAVEHGKKFLWEFCRDFVQQVELPDYKELMKTVRQDMALERQKEREKKERERKRRLKEKLALEEERKKKRRARLRRKREREKMKLLKSQAPSAPPKNQRLSTSGQKVKGRKRQSLSPESEESAQNDLKPLSKKSVPGSETSKPVR
jgi:hypothetical protein